MVNKNASISVQTRKFIIASLTLCLLLTAARFTIPMTAYADSNAYSWTRQDNLDLLGGDYTAVAGSADGSRLIVGTTGGGNGTATSPLYVSSNYGANWQDVSENVDNGISNSWQAVAVSDTGQTMVAASNGGTNISNSNGVNGAIFISHDGGSTWTNISPSGPNQWSYLAISGDGSKIVALASDDTSNVYISNNGGSTWTTSGTTSSVNFWGFASISDNGNKVLVGGENSNYNSMVDISDDGGNSWQDVTPDPTGQVVTVSRAALSSNGNEMAVSTYGYNNNWYNAVHISSDDGADWTDVTPPNANTTDVWNAIALSGNGKILSVLDASNDEMYLSNNDGTNWSKEDPDQSYNDADSNSWNSVAIDENGTHTIVASSGYAYTGYQASLEDNTVTFPSAVSGSTIQLTIPSGTNLTCYSTVSQSSLPVQDGSYTYPLGLLDYCLNESELSDKVTITFVTNLTPNQVTLRGYDANTKVYSTIAGAVITETTYNGKPALQVTYSISDSNLPDTDPNFGATTDPIGLAVLSTTASPSAPDTGFGQPNGNKALNFTAPLSLISLATGLMVSRVRRSTKHQR